MLTVNDHAPFFSALNQDGQRVALDDYLGRKHLVLYFYPKDDTPGCTLEANEFTALAAQFAAADTVVIGVSKDDCASHRAFVNKFGLNVQLLADGKGEICDSYGVWQEKEKNGVKKMGIVRSTFVIGKDGRLKAALYGVSPQGHAADMLALVKRLSSSPRE